MLWALRGGGGNFGVATRLDFRLHPVDRVVGGVLEYRGEGVRDVLRAFRDVVARSPRDLSCQAVISLDESLTPAVLVAPCFTGSDRAPAELDVLRSAPGLVTDDVREQTFLEQQLVFDSPYGENRHYWKGHFVRELSDDLIDELLARIVEFGRPPLTRPRRVPPRRAEGRGRRSVGARVSRSRVQRERDGGLGGLERRRRATSTWARSTAAAVEPWSFGGGYANYMQADEPLERVRAAFGASRVRPASGAEDAVRPDERPAPESEHPAGLTIPSREESNMDWKLELVAIPVSDVDRAKVFYTEKAGFVADHDHRVSDEIRFVQLTPPGSACSIALGKGVTDAPPGSVQGMQMVVSDIHAAHDELAGRGVEVSDVQEFPWGSFVFFSDPDGNRWAVQQLPPR